MNLDSELRLYRDMIMEQFEYLDVSHLSPCLLNRSVFKLTDLYIPMDAVELFDLSEEFTDKVSGKHAIPQFDKNNINNFGSGNLWPQSGKTPSREVNRILEDDSTRRIVFLGGPGSGKTCLLRRLAVKWAERDDISRHPVPLISSVNSYLLGKMEKKVSDMRTYLHAGCSFSRDNLHRWLIDGNLTLLFDGLDELPAKESRLFFEDIHRFFEEFTDVRMILTSGTIQSDLQDLKQAGFRFFALQDFSREKIDRFIRRWHERCCPEKKVAKEKIDGLIKSVHTSVGVGRMAGNPYLLTLMAYNNTVLRIGGSLLEDRIMEAMFDFWNVDAILTERFPMSKISVGCGLKAKIMEKAAGRMMKNGDPFVNRISGGDFQAIVVECLKDYGIFDSTVANDLLQAIPRRAFILAATPEGGFTFFHHSIFEFFAARYLAQCFEDEIDPGEAVFQDLFDAVLDNPQTDSFRTGIMHRLIGAAPPGLAGEISDRMIDRVVCEDRIDLVFRIAESMSYIKERVIVQKTAEKLLRFLIFIIAARNCPYSKIGAKKDKEKRRIITDAMRSVAVYFDHRPEVVSWLFESAFSETDPFMRIVAMKILFEADIEKTHPQVLDVFNKALSHANPDIRIEALKALPKSEGLKSSALNIFKSHAFFDADESVQAAVLMAIPYTKGWLEDKDIPHIARNAADEERAILRSAGVYLLDRLQGVLYRKELMKVAITDADERTRLMALSILADSYYDDREVLNTIKTAIANDRSAVVRKGALAFLYLFGIGESAEMLKKCIRTDPNVSLRIGALQMLMSYDVENNEALDILAPLALAEEEPSIRSAAIRLMAEKLNDMPETVALLKNRATADDEPEVRKTAVLEAARHFSGDAEVADMVKSLANDHRTVRGAVATALSTGWGSDMESFEIVKNYALTDKYAGVRESAVAALSRGVGGQPGHR